MNIPVANMLNKKDSGGYLSAFSQKIQCEQLAICSEIKKYKLNYLNKAVESSNVESFVRFTRQLQLLIVSYCKNIIFVAPQNLPTPIEELTILFDDLLSKFQHISLKYQQKGEQSAQQLKGPNFSELCAVCSQQMKKVSVEKMRSYLMNEIDLKNLQNNQDSESHEEEDTQFFEQVNKLLNMKQGELLKNQLEINNYKEVALNALEYLTTLKDHFARESIVMPSTAWMGSAKQQMQNVLRESFQGKIPPWISKMLNAFCSHYQTEIEKKRSEVGTQTESQLQVEIIELRRKVVVAKEKLHYEEGVLKSQEKELAQLKGEKGNLEGKIDYYKRQLNKLIEEIENAKMENQILRMKLNNAKFAQADKDTGSNTDSNHEIFRDYFVDPRRTQKMRSKITYDDDERMLPKIKGKSDSKNSQHLIRTSIKVNLSSQSHSRLERKKSTKRIEKDSEATIANPVNAGKNEEPSVSLHDSLELEKVTEREWKSKKNSNLLSDLARPKSVIKEEFGELSMDEYRMKIKEVDQHLKTAIKEGNFLKNGQKHFFSSVSQHAQLKRVPRRTVKAQDLDSTNYQPKNFESSLKRNNLLRLSKIYNYLKDSGYLIKISEQDFKQSISNLKFDDPEIQQNSLSNTKRGVFKSKKYLFEKDCLLKRSLYEQSSDQDSKPNNSLELTFQQNLANNYLTLFISTQNAYVYESNLTKNNSNGGVKLNPSNQQLCQQLFQLIGQIKTESIEHYKSMCTFIRFPYQVISNSSGSLNLGNDMKYVSFQYYFQRILAIHEKCKKQEGVCLHLREFRTRLTQAAKGLDK